jgi:hypothetical protein
MPHYLSSGVLVSQPQANMTFMLEVSRTLEDKAKVHMRLVGREKKV